MTPRLTALRADHLPDAVRQSAALGWPYREADWRFAFDLGGGFAAEADGRLVATAMWWPYGEAHGSVGMIIVDPAMQGRGLGRALMEKLLHEAGNRTVFLNSTQEGLPLYTQLGFVACGQVFQHQAALPPEAALPAALSHLRPMQPADGESLRRLDRAATGMDRTALLDALLAAGTTMVVDRGAGVSAYASAREFGHGVVIGPVVASGASSAADSRDLIAALAGRFRGRFVRIDVTEGSGLSPWLIRTGLPCVGHAVPMVRDVQRRTTDAGPVADALADALAGAHPRLFALSNQSFG
ncbi:GNAT family N-acetyltransferase [Variovorax sp. DXTD-1]|uniref:GNAT family N-acetyltransferase n=1 Tax=Variovorax sp. DXTD-1 TaxID=2495592 RepID=UPI000F85C52B|nr:GNAT family N-acetyltransferase [Variovorax sp. DXTD-1]RST49588.1 N-acetyltransferase [Variovorax sp. DXTD-1]